jgi:hypothetical protein
MVSGRSRRTRTVAFRVPNEAFAILEFLGKQKNMSAHDLAREIILTWLRLKGYMK